MENIKGFNTSWICPGAKSLKKDELKSHLQTNQHKGTEQLEKQIAMHPEVYSQMIVEKSPIGHAGRKLERKTKPLYRLNSMWHTI